MGEERGREGRGREGRKGEGRGGKGKGGEGRGREGNGGEEKRSLFFAFCYNHNGVRPLVTIVRSTPLPSSLSRPLSPLLREVVVAMETGYISHDLLEKCFKCVNVVMENKIVTNSDIFNQLIDH